MLQALLYTALLAVGSFVAAGVLVLALVRTIERLDIEPAPGAPWPPEEARADRRRRFLRRRSEPGWWPEFERAFANHVRGDAGRTP
jgi:hypothetical protein